VTAAVELDPVTFEVIRHRLWAINDEQGRMAARLSGSPVVYEARDFNAGLTTADGRGLMTGVYILHQGAAIETFARRVLVEWPREQIREGDMFFSNDPVSGALHANDGIVAMPLFWDGEIVAWAGIVMHDNDVGSPVPGSFVYGARDRFGEAPLIPGIKIAEDYELRPDLLATYLRNSRTPDSNALNMHARVAALTATRERIRELIEQYGCKVFLAAQEAILAYVGRILRERLREIPDGSWFAQTYHDNDTITDERFALCCRVHKRDDHLTLDMTGTAPQAAGPINCRRAGMEVAIWGVVFTYLCYDLPWATGALHDLIEIVSEGDTINDADETAPASMASLMAVISTQDVVADAFAKMLLSSAEHRDEAQATWAPVGAGGQIIGADTTGKPFFGHLMEGHGGGGGARTFEDGVDSGGIFHSMACTLGNAETFEASTRMLYLYRRQLIDGGGPGRFRGGVPVEFGVVAHGAGGPCMVQVLGSSFRVPGGRGLSGGNPGAAAHVVVARGADPHAAFAAGRLPQSVEALGDSEVEVLPAKSRLMLGPGDALFGATAGGAGYGDPLRREPARVERDVALGLVSEAAARVEYGIALGADDGATAALREDLRAERLQATEARPGRAATRADESKIVVLHPVSDTVEAISAGRKRVLRCTVCHFSLAAYDEDHRRGCVVRERSVVEVNPNNRYCSDDYVLREYMCPGCATLVVVHVQQRDEAPLDESRFGSD
jgi:N-methylhydantoinase B